MSPSHESDGPVNWREVPDHVWQQPENTNPEKQATLTISSWLCVFLCTRLTDCRRTGVCFASFFFFFFSILAFVTHGNALVFTSHRAQSWLFILVRWSSWVLAEPVHPSRNWQQLLWGGGLLTSLYQQGQHGSSKLLEGNITLNNNLSQILPGLSLYTPH